MLVPKSRPSQIFLLKLKLRASLSVPLKEPLCGPADERFQGVTMRQTIVALLSALGVGISAPASAATYNFSFTETSDLIGGNFGSGSGTFTTSDTAVQYLGQTTFEITSITGTVDGSAIVAPIGANGYGAYYTTGPSSLDGAGANFKTASGTSVSFFFQENLDSYRINLTSPFEDGLVSATFTPVSTTPLPAALPLFAGGLGMVGLLSRRRRRKALAVA
jgi:hypothetical protein